MKYKKKLTKIKGDASSRKFFRKKENKKNSILVYSKKEKFKNLLVYDAINKILNKNRILAPKLYKEDYKKSMAEYKDGRKKSRKSKRKKRKGP